MKRCDDLPEISVRFGDRHEDGSCNACQSRTSDLVTVVSLSTITFRLCPACHLELVRLMQYPDFPGADA